MKKKRKPSPKACPVLVEWEDGKTERFESINGFAEHMYISRSSIYFWMTNNPRYQGYKKHGIKAIRRIEGNRGAVE